MPGCRIVYQKFPVYIFFLMLTLFCTKSSGQYRLNYGLSHPQDKSTLPRSRAAYTPPVLKPKTKPQTILQPLADNTYNISNGWQLIAGPVVNTNGAHISAPGYPTANWYNAIVPGTVLTTLVKQGVYPDPYYGLNNLQIPDSLCREDWWYRTAFKIPAGAKHNYAFLNFEGINYMAEIWLNGAFIGTIKGAFKQGVFNISGRLNKTGENILAVHILPPPDPGIPDEESPAEGTGPNGGTLCMDGPTFIATEGWDWIPGIRDRDMGIWQNVTLKFTGPVTINGTHVVTSLPLPDTTSASVVIETELNNLSARPQNIVLKGAIGNIKFKQHIQLYAHQDTSVHFTPVDYKQLNIRHPRLWWPNGYGKPDLYYLKLSAADSHGNYCDVKTIRFGIRELTYELTVAMPGGKQERVIYRPVTALKNKMPLFDNINRVPAKHDVAIARLRPGTDTALLLPCNDTTAAPYLVIKVNGKRIYCKGGNWGMDDAMKNVSRGHLEPYFKLHRDAHFNMIRNWTGESTEETFYDLCDEYGMLVWNDFWLSTQGYNLDVKDDSLFLTNARDVVKRFRNHPSIAVWCPRNEGYAPPDIENKLAAIIAEYDGTRYYQPNSRLMNLRTSGPWNYFKHPQDYEKIAAGFSTELGSPSVPTAATMRKMMAKSDVWPIGDVWYYHDLHDGQKGYIAAMDSLYGKAANLEDFCKKAQMLNYDSYRAMLEGWQSHLWNNTSGLLLWMSHPAWPSTDWQTYSWDYETFGSYFGAMKACEPVHIQMSLLNNQVMVINTSLHAYKNVKAQMQVYDLRGKQISVYSENTRIGANQLTRLFRAHLPARFSGIVLIRLKLKDAHNRLLSQNDYWKNLGNSNNFKAFNSLGVVHLGIKKINATLYQVANNSQTPAIAVKLNLVNGKTGQIILPAYFSDGYFNLLPGESKTVSVNRVNIKGAFVRAGGYNVK